MKLLVLALLILYDSMLIFQLEHVKALDTMAPYAWESGTSGHAPGKGRGGTALPGL